MKRSTVVRCRAVLILLRSSRDQWQGNNSNVEIIACRRSVPVDRPSAIIITGISTAALVTSFTRRDSDTARSDLGRHDAPRPAISARVTDAAHAQSLLDFHDFRRAASRDRTCVECGPECLRIVVRDNLLFRCVDFMPQCRCD